MVGFPSLSSSSIASLLDQSAVGWFVVVKSESEQPQVQYSNPRGIALLQVSPLGWSFSRLIHCLFEEKPPASVLTSLETWPPKPLLVGIPLRGLELQILPTPDGVFLSLLKSPLLGVLPSPVEELNAQLEEEVQQRTTQLEQAIAWEAILKRITDRVRDSLDQDQILQQAVRELALALNVSSCNAALYDLAQSTSTIYYEYARNIPASQGRVARMNDYPELYNQLLETEYFQFCSVTPSPVRGRVAMLACPIFDNEGVLGDLWLVNRADYAFSEFEIRFVQQAANQCAIALRQAKLYQASQAQVRELENLNRLKDDFLSTVSHELRTPMSNMRMAIRMLGISTQKLELKTEAGEPEKNSMTAAEIAGVRQRLEHYLVILQKECEREIQLINDLLDLQRLEAKAQAMEPESIQLQDWLPLRLHPFEDRISSREQHLEIDLAENLPAFESDPESLERIIAELMNNACKYTPPEGTIRVGAALVDGQIEIQVCNTGVEISPQEQLKIFEKFYRIASNDPWKQGGTGLGLALVRSMAEHLGGTIDVQSADQETAFILVLPGSLVGS